jgi:Fe-S oxidoreductase
VIPAYKADQLRKVWKREHDWLGRVFPWFVGAEELDEAWLDKAVDVAYGSCTLCRRCVVNCPFGVDTPAIVGAIRAMLTATGRTPAGLAATVQAHLETGNNMSISQEDIVDTLEWMEEELQEDVGNDGPRIPVDKKGARMVYTINPREGKYFPLTIQAAAKVFYAAGEDWTVDSKNWDVTNYALFTQDMASARIFSGWIVEAVERIGAEELVMGECGHGYRVMRWEAPNWLGRDLPFRVTSMLELMARYIKEGRIKLDSSRNAKRYTYHDSCNVARYSGVIDEPRLVIRHAVSDFVEMEPQGANNYCCGGGGGMMAMTEYAKRRVEVGKLKAEQIRATGAKVVLTACHNCVDALKDLNKEYKLGIEVQNVCEPVADALILS